MPNTPSGRTLTGVAPAIPVAFPSSTEVFGSFSVPTTIRGSGRSLANVTPQVPKILAGLGLDSAMMAFAIDPQRIHFNTTQSYTATCPPLYAGTPVTVTIGPGAFSSLVSQSIADQLALNAATAAAQAALVCNPAPPSASVAYLSAQGSFRYEGYIDCRYMRGGNEGQYRGTSSGVPNYTNARTYREFNRVFYSTNKKFYRSLANFNLNNTPDISPAWWAECEIPVFYLNQAMAGDFHVCNFLTPATGCSPGQYLTTRRDFDYAWTGSMFVTHSTGIETDNSVTRQWSNSIVAAPCIQNGAPAGVATLSNLIQSHTVGGVAFGIDLGICVVNQSTFTIFQDVGSCFGGGGSAFGMSGGNAPTRTFSTRELVTDYNPINGVLALNSAGQWSDAWTSNGSITAVKATFSMSGALPLTSWTLTVNYASTSGPVPASEAYPFTLDALGTATVVVGLPFGSVGSSVSIASYSIA